MGGNRGAGEWSRDSRRRVAAGTAAADDDGGAIFKFLPDTPHGGGQIGDLSQSPLASGRLYAMTLSCRAQSSSSFPQYG